MSADKTTKVHYDIRVRGRVQGVGFRYSAQAYANNLGITGYVRNMQDGSVSMEIEGTRLSTDLMVEWCRNGPATGVVQDISVSEGVVRNYDSFFVRY